MSNNRFESHLIENREVRIFLSSTFADMKAERDALIKTFQALKVEANKRNVTLTVVDLRWGVTDEESRTGKVLSVCLNEIEHSHPFFIGLLGSRYGYSPNESELQKNPDLIERYPWLSQDIAQELSITEIEMQYGVLRNQNNVDAAFFVNTSPDAGNDDNPRLTAFKKEIRKQKRFPVEDYKSLDDLCTKVEKAVIAMLNCHFREETVSPLDRVRTAQTAYMNSRHAHYVKDDDAFRELDEFLTDGRTHLVVTGPSGMGKSALIANWLKDLNKRSSLPCKVICHFVGNSADNNGYEEILRHIIDELCSLYGLEHRPEGGEKPEDKAQRLLNEATVTGEPLLIVIDGINQIDSRDNSKLLNWLPQSPRMVKYLFSTLEADETMQAFRQRSYPKYTIGALKEDKRRQFVVDYLRDVGKRLDEDQLNRILRDPENKNMLVLKTLLDELICFGSYEKLDERVDFYLSATSINDFFDRVLQRMESDYQDVAHILSLIALSERGLSDEEILAITNLRPVDWHLFYCAFYNHFVTRDGLVCFSHQYISDAVRSRYHITDASSVKSLREEIVGYFLNNDSVDNDRKTSELAYQYYHIGDHERLYRTILSFHAFRYFYKTDQGEAALARYWRMLIESNSEHYQLSDYLDRYRRASIASVLFPASALFPKIGTFISYYFADYKIALKFYFKALAIQEKHWGVGYFVNADTYDKIGSAYAGLGNYRKALKYYTKALAIEEEVLGQDHLDTARSYNNIGWVYDNLGNNDEALKFYTKALAIQEKVLGLEHSSTANSYNNIGSVYSNLGNYDEALKYYKKALTIKEKVLGLEHSSTATSYNNIGSVYDGLGNYDEALKYHFKALAIREKVLSLKHPDTAVSYNNIGLVYKDLGNYDEALKYHFKALAIREKVFGLELPFTATSYHNIGSVYDHLGMYNEALKYYTKTLAIREKVLGLEHPDTAGSYNNIGAAYADLGNYDEALKYYTKALAIREEVLGLEHPDTAASYNNIGWVYYDLGNYDEALKYYNKALSIREEVLGLEHPDTAASYNNIGWVYYDLGNYDEALKYHFKALAIREKVLGLEHPDTATSYCSIGWNYRRLGNYGDALKYHSKALTIREKVLGLEHSDTAWSYNEIGLVYKSLGNYDEALKNHFKALAIREKVLGQNYPDIADSYYNIGKVYDSLGNYDEALRFYNKALAVDEKVFGPEHSKTNMDRSDIEEVKKKMQ